MDVPGHLAWAWTFAVDIWRCSVREALVSSEAQLLIVGYGVRAFLAKKARF